MNDGLIHNIVTTTHRNHSFSRQFQHTPDAPGLPGKTRRLKGAVDAIAVDDRELSAEAIQNLVSTHKLADD